MAINARYDGVCPMCGEGYTAGTRIERHRQTSAWCHSQCADSRLLEAELAAWDALSKLTKYQMRTAATLGGVNAKSNGVWLETSVVAMRLVRRGLPQHELEELMEVAREAAAKGLVASDTFADSDASKARRLASKASTTSGVATASAAAQVAVDAAGLEAFVECKKTELSAWVEERQQSARDSLERAAEGYAQSLADTVGEAVARVQRRELTVVTEVGEVVLEGHQHERFQRLLAMVGAGANVWVAGPAGSGKTRAASDCAKALGLSFRFNGAIDSEYKLSGFVDAQGRVVSTAFRDAWTNGGLYLFDECDASMPSALLAFNAALSGELADFPGEAVPVPRHEDFRCLAAANTWGFGGDSQYVGRMRLDAAFLDRFAFLHWDYDEDLERRMVSAAHLAWVEAVQALRRRARKRGLKVVVSPRASVTGARLLAAGVKWDEAMDACVLARLEPGTREALLKGD